MSDSSPNSKKQQGNFFATLRFLTVLPTPKVNQRISPKLFMFPLVGLVIGLILYIASLLFSGLTPFASAFIILSCWVGITGFLHLDGLADLADGLGAAHHNPERLLAVMKEPNIGAFGVAILILVLLGKFAFLTTLASAETWIALFLIPAWARLGAAWWASSLDPLSEGLASWVRQADSINLSPWFIILLVLSLLFSPILILAPAILWAWKAFLTHKLGGMNGDCLGAGIEVSELALLFLCALTL